MLSEKFDDLLVKIGNPNLEHPIFYHAPVGIRFEIGYEDPIYFDDSTSDDMIINPKYITTALQREKFLHMMGIV